VRTPVTVGVVCGVSGLGATLARAFDELPQSTLRWICDEAPRIASVGYGPATAWTSDFEELLQDEDLDAVVFASSELAARGRAAAALAADKHVFVDGQLASSSNEADELVAAAAKRNRHLMAHSPALLRPGVLRLHRLIDRGSLGEIFYVHARRYALRAERDIDVLWDLGADTIATVLDLLGDEPVEAHASGVSYLGRQSPDVIFAKLEFATGIGVYVHLSCLEGATADHISVVGSEATAVLDATEPEHELSILVNGPTPAEFDDLTVEQGDKVSFRLPAEHSLPVACARFLTAVRSQSEIPYGREASTTLAVLEALELSCANRGTVEAIAPRPGRIEQNVIAFRAR
jgi:predicted dehydrogenase